MNGKQIDDFTRFAPETLNPEPLNPIESKTPATTQVPLTSGIQFRGRRSSNRPRPQRNTQLVEDHQGQQPLGGQAHATKEGGDQRPGKCEGNCLKPQRDRYLEMPQMGV